MMDGTVAALHRFPVKGLSPERLGEVRLLADDYVPGDRLFAIENGPSGYEEDAPRHLPKIKFLMLMRNERLAKLTTRFDAERGRLAIVEDGRTVCDAPVDSRDGEEAIARFFAGYCADELRGPPRLRASRPGFRFTDSAGGFVSILNLASVREVDAAVGRTVDPLRFRANVTVEGWAPWVENDLVGRRVKLGDSLIEVTALTDRCAATDVDPATGARDMTLVRTLMSRFGHNVCGVYGRVVEGGAVREGDAVTVP